MAINPTVPATVRDIVMVQGMVMFTIPSPIVALPGNAVTGMSWSVTRSRFGLSAVAAG